MTKFPCDQLKAAAGHLHYHMLVRISLPEIQNIAYLGFKECLRMVRILKARAHGIETQLCKRDRPP